MNVKEKLIELPLPDAELHPHLRGVTHAWEWVSEDGVSYRIFQDEPQGIKHLRIRRYDDEPVSTFNDMQAIKNAVWGQEVVAVQVYPRVSDYINRSNTYHLWTCPILESAAPNLKRLYEYKTGRQQA